MGLLDALGDEDFQRGMLRDLVDTGNRGVFAGLLGAPVDASAGVVNAAIMAGGLLGQGVGLWPASELPQPITKPVGGSEWLGDKLQGAGYVTANRNPLAEGLAAFAVPGAMAKVGSMLPVLEMPKFGRPPTGWRGSTPAVQQRGGPIYPEGKARLQADLEAGVAGEPFLLGDVTQGQANALARLGLKPPKTNEVTMPKDVMEKLIRKRMGQDNLTPEEIANIAERAMAKRSQADIDPSKRFQQPALVNRGLIDPVTGLRYDARMPMASDGKTFEARSIFPDGLPPRPPKK